MAEDSRLGVVRNAAQSKKPSNLYIHLSPPYLDSVSLLTCHKNIPEGNDIPLEMFYGSGTLFPLFAFQ